MGGAEPIRFRCAGGSRLIQEKGTTLLAALVLLMSLTILGLVAVDVSVSELRATADVANEARVRYQAEAGAEEARMRFDPADPNYYGVGLVETGPTYSPAWQVCVGSATNPEAVSLGCNLTNTVASIQATVPFDVAAIQHATQGGIVQCYNPDQFPPLYNATAGACQLGHAPLERITGVASAGQSKRTMVGEFIPAYMTPFSLGIKGRDTVTLAASACTDSYDSKSGPYSGSVAFCTGAGNQGDVGTDSTAAGGVDLDLTATVNGDVSIGPGGNPATVVTGSGTINGTTLPASVVPSYPTPPIPAGVSCISPLTVSGGSTVTIGTPGASTAYCYTQISISGGSTLETQGTVTIYVTGTVNVTGSEIRNLSTTPWNLMIVVTVNQAVTMNSGNDFHGCLYAPQSALTVTGGGHFYGAMLAKDVTISGGSTGHFDAALVSKTIGVANGYRWFTWREL